MTRLTAFLHGYPPEWAMGGEVSTHRTLRHVPGSTVFTVARNEYEIDGVRVLPVRGTGLLDVIDAANLVSSEVLFGHSTMSQVTVRAARRLHLPSILAVHAPPRFAADLRRAWSAATVRLYNTHAARQEWADHRGWLLHPPVGKPTEIIDGPHDAFTLTSSLLNKGVNNVLALARMWPDRRFIIVESPAHPTHGDRYFWEDAAKCPNVEVRPRAHPNRMGELWAETRVLLVPSRYETYGLSALEAAWYGVPSVHVDTIHVREGIGTAARLLRSAEADELARAVVEVDRDYDRWSEGARARVESLAVREARELDDFAAGVASLAHRG